MSFFNMIATKFSKLKAKELKEVLKTEPVYGIRLNREKNVDLDFEYERKDAYPDILFPKELRNAVAHPFHHAGAYYIQDPHAALVVNFMDLNKNDVVLDLCAAPGGKSLGILNEISDGFLLANEIDYQRNINLQNNIRRWAHLNVAVSQNSASELSNKLASKFDKILVDAPCSSEGLFRRKKDLVERYNEQNYETYISTQLSLLREAFKMIKNEGVIVYSTCTLNPYENEGVVDSFLIEHPSCYLEKIEHPNKDRHVFNDMPEVARFFPSEFGEGQFVARIICKKDTEDKVLNFKINNKEELNLGDFQFNASLKKHDKLFHLYKQDKILKEKINLKPQGIPLFSKKNEIVKWTHYATQYPEVISQFPRIEVDLKDAYLYLNGQALPNKSDIKGWVTITYRNQSLGFAKGVSGRLNNLYPKSLRNRFEKY